MSIGEEAQPVLFEDLPDEYWGLIAICSEHDVEYDAEDFHGCPVCAVEYGY